MRRLLAAFGCFLLGGAGFAVGAPPAAPPAPARWVTDSTGFLSDAARQALDARLEAYEASSGHQFLVWIGPLPEDSTPEDFAEAAFRQWGVGRKGKDDGLVLFVFPAHQKLRFEVGYGLEDKLPDILAIRIIRDVIAPRIRAGDRDGAVSAGVGAAIEAIDTGAAAGGTEGATEREGGARRRGRELSSAEKVLIALLVLGFLVLLITNPTLAIYLLANILSGSGRGSGYASGGGGFSGGGGRSGGGGATGSW